MTHAANAAPRVGFVLHVMQVAGAEMLVAETIRRLGRTIDPVVLCLDGVGQLGEQMRSEGVPVVELHRRPGLDLALPRRMAAQVERYGLDVIHAHQYTPFFYTALARPFVRRPVHVIFTEHGRHYPDVVSTKRRLINRFVLARFADEINGVSQFSVDSLARVDGFGSRTLDVIPNGIDALRYAQGSRSDAKVRVGLDVSRRHIACIARFHPIKDHAMLLQAFALATGKVPDVDLVLAGDGPLRAQLTEQATSLGVASRVRFLGVRSDVPDILRAVDVFALTSIAEAASITLLEAMASELPVVVTDVGGNPEIVKHGVEGLLVPRGDAAAAAAAFVDLLTDRQRAERMGRAGRARVLERYQLDTTVATYYARYSDGVARVRKQAAHPRTVHA
jgi:glycosyltransferase involved in cell wall biosynthesis